MCRNDDVPRVHTRMHTRTSSSRLGDGERESRAIATSLPLLMIVLTIVHPSPSPGVVSMVTAEHASILHDACRRSSAFMSLTAMQVPSLRPDVTRGRRVCV